MRDDLLSYNSIWSLSARVIRVSNVFCFVDFTTLLVRDLTERKDSPRFMLGDDVALFMAYLCKEKHKMNVPKI